MKIGVTKYFLPKQTANMNMLVIDINHNTETKMKPRTATASFRLDESALATLQEDAKTQNVSVNTLLNQLILSYANYDRPMNRFHIVKMPASTFRYILQGANDESIIEAGTSVGNDVPRTFIQAKWGQVTVENCLEYLKTMSKHAKLYDFSEVVEEGNISVTLTHDFGAKGSLFLQHYVKAIFAPMGKPLKFSANENAVVFELL
jgi:hypothetical protein